MRDVISLPVLRGTSVLAGASGLDRRVSGVNVMEVPDIEAYIAPGDLLLTTAYAVRDRPERLVDLLSTFAARGLGALAIAPLRYLGRLPDHLVEEADRLRFPVLVLPDGTSFNQVIGGVLAVVLSEYGAEPGRAEALRERLTGVALAGGGLEEIARTLAGALDREVLILDDGGESLGHAQPLGGRDTVATAQPPLNLVECPNPWIFPITVASTTRGRILIGGESEPSLGQRRLIRQACFAAGMHIAQALAGIELDRRLRVLLLEELVSRDSFDEPRLRQHSRLFGWDLAGERVVLLAHCSSELTDGVVCMTAVAALPHGSFAWSRGHQVVALVAMSANTAALALNQLAERWRTALIDAGAARVTVAVGSPAAGPAQLAASHGTAQEALRIATQTDRPTVRFDDLDLERLLLAIPPALLAEYVERKIGNLAWHDAHDGSDLCATLEAYLGLGNAAEAARKLFIHYNTMKHRLTRIAELTAVDLHDPRSRLALALALQIRTLT